MKYLTEFGLYSAHIVTGHDIGYLLCDKFLRSLPRLTSGYDGLPRKEVVHGKLS